MGFRLGCSPLYRQSLIGFIAPDCNSDEGLVVYGVKGLGSIRVYGFGGPVECDFLKQAWLPAREAKPTGWTCIVAIAVCGWFFLLAKSI